MRAILVDDEERALDYLEHLLHSISDVTIIGKYSNPLEAKEHIGNTEVDVVFFRY